MYILPEPFLHANPLNKYAISSRARDPVYNPDASLTLFLGHDSPGGQLEPNRIPAPAGPFLSALRLYGPSAKVQNDQ